MAEAEFITAGEVLLKSDRTQGNMVVLKESENSKRYFLMFIGESEMTAIAKEKGYVDPKRPLTHDMYLAILERAGVVIQRIEINDMIDNTYYARIYAKIDGEDVDFDSRPSDAVALALHVKCPIKVSEKLLRRELTPDEIKEYESIVKTVKF
jgi:bifunctional DNase/RNase